MTKPIHVLLATDYPLVCAGLRATLGVEGDLLVVGEATNGDDAQRLCRDLKPDVLLLDFNMPGPRLVQTVTNIHQHCPMVRVMMLTAHDDDYVPRLIAAGVAGYVLKDGTPEVVVQAISTVARGNTWFSQRVVEKLLQRTAGKATPAIDLHLSEREQQLLGKLAQGSDNAAIARELNLAEQTVRNYLSQLYAKLGVASRSEAMVWVRKHGIGND